MRLSVVRHAALLVPSCLLVAGAAAAQAPVPPAAARQAREVRNQIAIMEGVLERAVSVGMNGAVNEMRDLFQGQGPIFVAPPRARGFKIEGYGVFFDVEVPTLPATTWAMNVLARNNEIAIVNDLNQLRALIPQVVAEPSKRIELTRYVDRVQARASGASLSEPGVPPGGGAAVVTTPPAGSEVAAPRDPDAIYTEEVKKALVNVLLEQGITVQVAPEEWLTIAAGEARSGWGEPETMTVYLSIRGKDLAAVRARQITREEAVKRILVRNY